MAQVKKLQQGGTLNINGKEYTADQINDYLSSGQFSAQERAALAGTVRAIQEGKSRYLDANSNSLSGDGNVNDDFADYFGSEWRANRGRSGWSNKKQNRHASRNSDFAIRDEALAKLGNIGNYLSDPKTSSVKGAKKLGMGNGWFYTDGKYVSGPQNLTNEKHIQDVFSYLAADEEGRKEWELSGWGDAMTGLTNWYKGQDVNGLLERIRGNALTDEDKEVLSYMGYSPTESDIVSAQTASMRDKFKKAGYDFDKWSGIIDIDDKGNAVLKVGEDGKTALSSLGGNGNYFFNDSFFANGQNQNLSFLKDHFVVDGKVYKASDAGLEGSELYNILRAAGGFYDKNKSGDWEGADQLIKHLWTGSSNYTLGNTSDTYSQFLYDNPNIRWTSITGAYDTPLNDGEQLIEYYDPNGDVDAYGYGTAKWAVLDSNGNFIREVDSRGNETGREAQALVGRKIARTESGNADHDGLVIHDFTDKTGKSTNLRIYKNPITGDMIMDWGGSDGDYKLPKEISDILNKYGDTFWNNLMQDSRMQKQFGNMMNDTVRSQAKQFFTGMHFSDISPREWKKLGLDEQDAKDIYKWFNYYRSQKAGNKDKRYSTRMVARPTLRKSGGIISKFQPGGAVGTNQMRSFTQHKLDTDYDNSENFAKLGQEKLSGADYAELAALGADAISIGLGVSGAPYASGIVGAAGSLSSFGADVARDGLDWGDAGNLGVNLAMDVVSLVPWAGSGAQSVKSVNKIRKAFPTILKMFSIWGVGDAATMSLNKIKNGDDWTVRDVRTVLNAIAGGISLSKTGLGGGQRPKKTTNEVEVKIKGKSTKLKLTDAEIKKINGATDKQKALADLVVSKKKVKVGDVDVTPGVLKRTWRQPKTWLSKETLNVTDTDVPVGWKQSISDRKGLLGWASGRSYNQAQYNEFLRTGQWKEIVSSPDVKFTKTKPDSNWKNVVEVKNPTTGEVIGYKGNPPVERNATSVLNKADKWNFKNQTARQRELMRRAAIFTPNFTLDRNDKPDHSFKEGYVPMIIPIVVPQQQDLASRSRFKTGGIIKAQSGVKFSEWTPEKQQQYKDALEAAKTAGQTSFVFDGQTYGISKALPESSVTVTGSPLEGDLANEQNWTAYADGSAIYKGPGKFTYSETITPELPSVLTDDFPTMNQALEGRLGKYEPVTLPEFTTDYADDYEAIKHDAPTSEEIEAIIANMKGATPEEIAAKREYLSKLQGYDGPEGVIAEASLASDIASAGYDAKTTETLLRKQQRWSNRAARDAARMVAGNTPGVTNDRSTNLSNIFRAGKLLNAFSADQFQRKMARNVYDSTMRGMASDVPEHYDRFQDYGIGEQYRQAANNARRPIVNVNSDVNAMYADQRARSDQATKLELEGGLKQSQLYSDWNDKQNELRRTYAAKRTETENANRLRAVNAENAYWTQMGASRAQRQNVIDNALTEQLGLYTQDRAMNYQLADQNETTRYKYEADNIKSEYQNRLNDAISSGTLSANTTLDDYFAANPTEYQNYTNRMKTLQQDLLDRRLGNYKKYNQQSIFSAKKGGKVSDKRSASEQIWIDNQKHSSKAIERLSKQAFEFLKMALS